MNVIRTRGIRTPLRFVALAFALCLATLVAGGAAPVAADQISDKKAQAARLADKVEQLSSRSEILDEDLREAEAQVSALGSKIAQSEASIVAADTQAESLRIVVKDQAIAAYVRGSATSLAASANVTNAADSDTAKQYAQNLLASNNDALDSLRALRMAIDEQRIELAASKEKADEAASNVSRKLDQVKQARAEQASLLKQTQGELAALIAEEQARRAAAEAERVRQELASRRAAQNARRAASTSSSSAPSGPAPGANVPAPNSRAGVAVAEARKQLGKPYDFASAGAASFDCSGLTMWSWNAAGEGLPHSSRAQYQATTHIDVSDIKPGDLVFFGRPIHHVGIYVGDGQMIDAPHSGAVVRYASIYRRDLVGVGRVS